MSITGKNKTLSIAQVADIIRSHVTCDTIFGLQGVDRAAAEIVLATVETDD